MTYSLLDCEPEGRGEFLDKECAGDPDLRRDVEGILAAYEEEEE
jgi:hypothetical protein